MITNKPYAIEKKKIETVAGGNTRVVFLEPSAAALGDRSPYGNGPNGPMTNPGMPYPQIPNPGYPNLPVANPIPPVGGGYPNPVNRIAIVGS